MRKQKEKDLELVKIKKAFNSDDFKKKMSKAIIKEKEKDLFEEFDEVGKEKRKEYIDWVKQVYYKNIPIRKVDDNALHKVISFAWQDGIKEGRVGVIREIDKLFDKHNAKIMEGSAWITKKEWEGFKHGKK